MSTEAIYVELAVGRRQPPPPALGRASRAEREGDVS